MVQLFLDEVSMGWFNKVVWSEGLFLRPQMLQQQERYLEYFSHQRSLPLNPFFWGFSRFEIDSDGLTLGKLSLKAAKGLFLDGTPFNAPNHDNLPKPIHISHEMLGQTIFLAIPLRMHNAEETLLSGDLNSSLARFLPFEYDLQDSTSVNMGSQLVQLARLRMELIPERELGDEWLGLPIARVTEILGDGSVRLDASLIPPVSNYSASTQLSDWLSEIQGLVDLRADALAHRLSSDSRSAHVAEVTDYLILQLLNRYQPLLNHFLASIDTPPEHIFKTLSALNGELSTFIKTQTRRPNMDIQYDHWRPAIWFQPLVQELRYMLNIVLERSSQKIEIEKRQHGLHLAILAPNEIESYASLVLGVSADMPKELLQHQFISQVKIASTDKLLELVRLHLPGLDLELLPSAPRQIAFSAGYIYFEIQQTGTLRHHVLQSGSVAMHVAGNFPNLNLELWGIRNQ